MWACAAQRAGVTLLLRTKTCGSLRKQAVVWIIHATLHLLDRFVPRQLEVVEARLGFAKMRGTRELVALLRVGERAERDPNLLAVGVGHRTAGRDCVEHTEAHAVVLLHDPLAQQLRRCR